MLTLHLFNDSCHSLVSQSIHFQIAQVCLVHTSLLEVNNSCAYIINCKCITKRILSVSFPPPSVPPEHGVEWLYEELAHEWRRWLPDYTTKTILKGAYYAVQVLYTYCTPPRPFSKEPTMLYRYCDDRDSGFNFTCTYATNLHLILIFLVLHLRI